MRSAYLDSAYLAKCYLDDPDSDKVRNFVEAVEVVYSSALCIAEVSCALHRAVREKTITKERSSHLRQTFSEDLSLGLQLIPVSESILRVVETVVARLPPTIFVRAGDAIHLASAQSAGFPEIWSNDRHLLSAAPHFGVAGRSV